MNLDKLSFYKKLFVKLNESFVRKIHNNKVIQDNPFLNKHSINIICTNKNDSNSFWLINEEQNDFIVKQELKLDNGSIITKEYIIRSLSLMFNQDSGFIGDFNKSNSEFKVYDLVKDSHLINEYTFENGSNDTLIHNVFKKVESVWGKANFKYVYIRFVTNDVDYDFIGAIPLLNEEEFRLFKYYYKDLLNAVFGASQMSDVMTKSVKELERASIKSAIAAIMSRNMSHNLGSHVFYYTRQNLLQIYENEKDNTGFPYTKEIKGLSWFLHYVQERQDFVANINSGDRYIFGPLNLKQDVIDEIAPDALDERHLDENNKDSKITKNYLLENIVKSEKISRHSNENKDLANIQIEIKYKNQTFNTGSDKVKNDFYNLDLAVQGGQQSRHAFLIMLENIIRNSAKHAFKKEENNNLTITIEVVEENGQNYNISIYDNTRNASIALPKLQKRLNNLKFIDDYNNTIDRSNKGIKEILVSVMWLKGLDFGEIENHAKKSDILKIENKDGNIAYSFSVPVFKKVESLKKEHIASILQDESLDIYASVFTVSNDEIRSYLESTKSTIKEKTIFEELNKRIPHLILIDENRGNPKNLWKDIYDSKFGYNHDRSLLLFDRSDDSSHNSKVKFINSQNVNDDLLKKSCIYFNNHLSKNKVNLIQTMNNINPLGDIIYESISGANQVFNLMQKFKEKSTNYSTEDLYWNVLLNYKTKIVIVDERLAFSKSSLNNLEDDLNKFVKSNEYIEKVFLRSGLISEFTQFKNGIDKPEDILITLNKRYKTVEKPEFINYQLPDVEKYAQYEYIPKISQDVYEKYKFQQNTFVFNLNSEDYVLTNSLDSKENIFLGYVDLNFGKFDIDFFTIHIGIIDKIKEKEKGKSTREIIGSILNINKINTKYICVHSGRGGLNDKDDKINFIPFSILQRCFEDSKFLLSEFLYNNQYIPL